MRRTKVIVIDYPDDKKERVEKKLKPLVLDANLNYGEVWEPYDGYACNELDEILENLNDTIIGKFMVKRKQMDERSEKILAEIAKRIHNNEDISIVPLVRKKIDTADRSIKANSS